MKRAESVITAVYMDVVVFGIMLGIIAYATYRAWWAGILFYVITGIVVPGYGAMHGLKPSSRGYFKASIIGPISYPMIRHSPAFRHEVGW